MPITCDELFKTVEGNADPDLKYCVTFSMMEIYNECVRDLLIKNNPKGGLPVSYMISLCSSGAGYICNRKLRTFVNYVLSKTTYFRKLRDLKGY